MERGTECLHSRDEQSKTEGKLQYRFYSEKDKYVTLLNDYSDSNSMTYNPGAGTYHIYVDMMDEKGNVSTQMFTFMWE